MNIETDSVSKSSTVSCITIEDDSDEVEVIDLDDEIEEQVPTYSFQNNASNIFIDTLDTSFDVEDDNLYPLHDPLVSECNENNKEEAHNCDDDANKSRSWISSCSHDCYLKVSQEDQKKVFQELCARKTQLSKFEFMNELIETRFKTVCNRNFSKFYLDTKPERQNICRVCFLRGLDITHDFLHLYFRYKLTISKQMTMENLENKHSIQKEKLLNDGTSSNATINIEEENLDDDDDVLRDKILRLGWKRIPKCKNMCQTGVPTDDQKLIFVSYWFRTTKEDRYKFISDMTDVSRSGRRFIFSYHLYTNTGVVGVCKSCFCTALNETEAFVHKALKIKCFKLQLSNSSEITRYEEVTTSQEIIDLEPETHETDSKGEDDKKDLGLKNDSENNKIDMEKELKDMNADNADFFDDIFETMEKLKYKSVDKYLEDKYNIRLSSRGCGCYLNITKENSKRSFYSYWKSIITARFNFVMELIELPKNTWKNPKHAFKRAKFFASNARGKSRRICKYCFLSVLDISKVFLDFVLEEMTKRQRDNFVSLPLTVFDETDQSMLSNDKLIESKLSQGTIPLKPCRFMCLLKVSKEDQEEIFNHYWRESTSESRYAFISDMVESTQKCRQVWHLFYLNTTGNGRVRICKLCFRSTINESPGFIAGAVHRKFQLNAAQLSFGKFFETDEAHSKFLTNPDDSYDDDDDDDDDDLDDYENYDYDNCDYDSAAFVNDVDKNDADPLTDSEYNKLLDKWTPLKACTSGCHSRLTQDQQKEIFISYWKNSTEETRAKFILEMTEVKPTLSYRFDKETASQRFLTTYYLSTSASLKWPKVCKACFKHVLLERKAFIQKVLEEMFISIIENQKNPEIKYDPLESFKTKANNVSQNGNAILNNMYCKCQLKKMPKWTPLPPCINDCHLKITDIEQRNIFLAFWQEKLFDSRFNFINRRTELNLQESSDPTSNKMLFRTGYYFVTHQGRQRVCKYCFYHILDVSKAFVSAVFNQKLYNMMKLNIIPILPTKTFLFFDDETLKPRTPESNELDCQVECDKCAAFCEIKIRQGVPQLIMCSNLCYLKITKNDKNRVFYDYYCQEKTIDAREKFICDMVRNITILFSNKKPDDHDECQDDKIVFCIHTESGIITICKLCFAKIINESLKFVTRAVQNKVIKYEDQLKLKNMQSISHQRRKKTIKSTLESALNHAKQVVPSFLIVKSKNKDNDSSKDTHQEMIKETNSFNQVFIKTECAEKTSVPYLDVEMEKCDSQKNSNQEKIDQIEFLSVSCPLKTEREGENIVQNENVDMNSNNHVKIDETNSLNDSCTVKSECEEEIISSDKGNELQIRNSEKNKCQESIIETKFICDFATKMECQEKNTDMSEEDSKSALKQQTESTISPLKRKSSQIDTEDTESFPGLSIIKEELDLENDAELETEKYQVPPEKIAKLNSSVISQVTNNENEPLIFQIPIIKHEPKLVIKQLIPVTNKMPIMKQCRKMAPKRTENTEANKPIDKIIKKRGPKKKTDTDTNFVGKVKSTTYSERKTRKEKFIEQEMQKILEKYGKDTTVEKNNENVIKPTNCGNPSHSDIEKVNQHIRKFPLCESYHYNGKSAEKYLPMGLTSKIMYDLYKQEVKDPVSSVWYNKLLEKTDLKFRTSFLTKCDVCSAAAVQYKVARDLSEKSKINSHRTAHLVNSEEPNNAQSLDVKTSKMEKNLFVCSFGFQQSLPTPYLTDPLSFYKQRLWTYNFTIRNHSATKVEKSRKCYLWDENQGARSINEMASCLYSYLKKLPSRVTNIIFYSTRNEKTMSKILAAMFLHSLLNHETLESIEHKFLVPGHSQIETILGSKSIEVIMNTHQNIIQEPNDWYEAFQKSTLEAECQVNRRNNFYNFDEIRDVIFHENHQFISEEDVKCLRYTKYGIFYNTGWSTSSRFQPMNLNTSLENVKTLKLVNLEKVRITEEKKRDLLELLPFLLTRAHDFYRRLVYDELVEEEDTACQSGPEIDESSEIVTDSIREKCQKKKTISPENNSIIKEKSTSKKKCHGIQDGTDVIEEICIDDDVCDDSQREKRNTKLLYENPHKTNEFELVLIKEEDFEQS